MRIDVFAIKAARKLHRTLSHYVRYFVKQDSYKEQLYEAYVQYYDQVANDYIREMILSGFPIMVSKFGTIEMLALSNWRALSEKNTSLVDCIDYIIGERGALWWSDGVTALCQNAGFFPDNGNLLNEYFDLNVKAMKEIDVLGSYQKAEKIFKNELSGVTRVNLDGYYAPFFFENPWTMALKGKRVLVIHPFVDSIQEQYKKRRLIWSNPDVLPDFSLQTIKAVQTIAGEETNYPDWFSALNSMEVKISESEFDIALIGCGAYGMPLAAHVKRMGKQAIHLAGWLQVLFGIKGKRWIDDPRVSKFMNSNWVRPMAHEIPKRFKTVENGCYW